MYVYVIISFIYIYIFTYKYKHIFLAVWNLDSSRGKTTGQMASCTYTILYPLVP